MASIDPFAAMIDVLYRGDLATDATFESLTGTLRVMDKSAGVDLEPTGGGIRVPTLIPACVVRKSDLDAHGFVSFSALMGKTVTFNGATWRIFAHRPKPQPRAGEAGGEFFLFLRNA